MSVTECKLRIDEILSKSRIESELDKINVCASIYHEIIKEGPLAAEILQYFLEKSYDFRNTAGSQILTKDYSITESEERLLRKQNFDVINALFGQQLSKNLPQKEFYKKVWEVVIQSPSLDTEKAKIFALYVIRSDARTPYYQLNLDNSVQMSNEAFSNYSQSLKEYIQKAQFILRTNLFEQRTSRASVLLDLIEELKSREEKAVLMSHLMAMQQLASLNQQLDELKKKLSKTLDDKDEKVESN